jgi:DNA-binding transcriptional LysR family regulator
MIDRLEMFLALANERHFGRAAEVCHVTQPTLSSAIRQLEDQLGVQLVFRGSRFQGLTPEGELVLIRARGIIADTRALREEMRAVRSGLSGTLRIGAIPTALPSVARLTQPFTARFPAVRITILSHSSAEILAGIERLELDAGITYLGNEPLGRVREVALYTEYYRLLCGPGMAMADLPAIRWADLSGVPLCLLTGDMQNRRIVNHHLAEAGVSVQPQIESNSTIALVTHVMSGQWASILPKTLADLFAGTDGLRAIPIIEPEAEHQVGLITTLREPHTPIVEALLDTARKLVA